MVAASPGNGDRPSLNHLSPYRIGEASSPRATIITCLERTGANCCPGSTRSPEPGEAPRTSSRSSITKRSQAGDHARPSLVRAAIALQTSRNPPRIRCPGRASKRTEKSGGAEAGDPVSAAATRSPSQPGEASCRLGSPYGVAQIGPSVECKRCEGDVYLGCRGASLWLGQGGCGGPAPTLSHRVLDALP